MLITRHLRATGLVQGVGFRDAMIIEAIALGIRGWVRNRADGSVEAVLHGDYSIARMAEGFLAATRDVKSAAPVAS